MNIAAVFAGSLVFFATTMDNIPLAERLFGNPIGISAWLRPGVLVFITVRWGHTREN